MPTTTQNRYISRRSSLRRGCVAYWRLEEDGGTRMDATGRGNNLTPRNTNASAGGRFGRAVQNTATGVSSTSPWIGCSSTPDLVMGDISFTIAGWVRHDTATAQQYYLSKWSGSGTQEYSILDDTGTKIAFYIANFGKSVTANTFGVITTATWYFVCCQHDSVADLIKISINNGAFDTAATAGSFPAAGTQPFQIGSPHNANNVSVLNGRADEWGIWKRLLSADEITALYNGAIPF